MNELLEAIQEQAGANLFEQGFYDLVDIPVNNPEIACEYRGFNYNQ